MDGESSRHTGQPVRDPGAASGLQQAIETGWRYGKRFSNACFTMVIGNLFLFLLLLLLMLPFGFVTGSWRRSITISGPPALDGPGIPWDVHVVHEMFHYLPWLELWTLCLAVLPYLLLFTIGVVRHGWARVVHPRARG